ncbi:MAG: MATE family efflux transporter [Spirochaetales bacterium]|nr:MATE family efflux transporter [Spirochaetales bacterium]
MTHKYIGTISFYKRTFRIALPVMAQLFVQTLVSLIDNFMVAGLGDIKMSGVNVVGQIVFVFIFSIDTVCMSGGIFMSQFFGAKDSEGMSQSFRFKLILGGIVGLGSAAVMFIAPRWLFAIMVTVNTDAGQIIEQSILYARASALSLIFIIVSEVISSSLREIEIVRPPLVISIIATLLNTFFNWVLIYGHLGAPRLEVIGAGYATVIARFAEMLMFLLFIMYRRQPFLAGLSHFWHIDFRLFGRIIRKSSLILYSECIWAISETISAAVLNTRGGADVVAGMNAGLTISHLFFICFAGTTVSTGVVIGQELGAGYLERAKQYKNWMLTGSLLLGCAFTLLGFGTLTLIPLVFGRLSLAARHIAFCLVIVTASYIPLWVYINTQYAVSRAGGDVKMGAVCDTISNILFIGSILILSITTPLGPVALYAIVKLSDIIKCLVAHLWLRRERWLVNLTK